VCGVHDEISTEQKVVQRAIHDVDGQPSLAGNPSRVGLKRRILFYQAKYRFRTLSRTGIRNLGGFKTQPTPKQGDHSGRQGTPSA
jgi:hypothetical protein